jgi:cysteine desulfurase / selenocysteine lyase
MNEKDFPFLKSGVHYLDNASMAQMPLVVAEKIKDFSLNGRANVGRSLYKLGLNATQEFERARKVVAKFINASPEEIIFTRGTTDSLNILANGLSELSRGKKILLTEMEHHSNLVPWRSLKLIRKKLIKKLKAQLFFLLRMHRMFLGQLMML